MYSSVICCQILPIGSSASLLLGTFHQSTHTPEWQWFRSVSIHKPHRLSLSMHTHTRTHTHLCASSWKLQSNPVGKSCYYKTDKPFGHWPDPLPHLPLNSLPASFSHIQTVMKLSGCSQSPPPTWALSLHTTNHRLWLPKQKWKDQRENSPTMS